jgi:hypothetical protein
LNNDGLLEQASLVITPNSVKEGKLFSIKPTDGSGDLSVVRATTKTRVNSLGVIESVPINVAALDYTNGSCPSILVEPQRTNLVLRSEEFDNAVWSKINTTITANSTNSPSGNLTADTIIDNATNSIHVCGNTGGGTGVYTFSFYAKANTLTRVGLLTAAAVNLTLASTAQVFDLSNGTVVNTISGVTATITNAGNGWYRCSVTLTALVSGIYYITCIKTGTNIGYIGSGESLFVWGAQLEAGANATSYIPTLASAVTRNADVISKTGISNLIGQTEGTIFFDGIVNSIQSSGTNILNTNKNPSVASQIALTKVSSTNKIRFEQFFGNGGFGNIRLESTNTFANGTRTKVAIRYKSGNFAMYINGVLEATSSSTFTNIGTKSDLFLNDSATLYAFQGSVSFNSVALWKETLNNTELAQLTTI